MAVASSLPHMAKSIDLWYETPSIIIHTVNDSDEDDTIDNYANDIFTMYFNAFKDGKRYREWQDTLQDTKKGLWVDYKVHQNIYHLTDHDFIKIFFRKLEQKDIGKWR